MLRRVFAEKHDQRKESGRRNTLPPPAKAEDNHHHALLSTLEKLFRTAAARRTDKCPSSHHRTCHMPTALGITTSKVSKGVLFMGDNHSDHKLSRSCSPNRTRQN